MIRHKTRQINIGGVKIGGGAPITVQSMCNTDTRNVKATVKQIKALEKAGCELVRVAIPNMAAAKVVGEIKRQINIPLIADIHFDYRAAIECAKQGVDKLRINPGNIGSEDKIKAIVDIAKKKGLPIRIGVNSGSLEKDILAKQKGKVTSKAMVESALRHIKILERYNFYDIIVSIKASDIKRTVSAYKLLAKKVNYPLHIGITEAGTSWSGTIRSAIGIGTLLALGIGDTIRVSLTANPVEEVKVGWEILKSLGLRQRGITITSCPTCGRTEIDLVKLTKEIEEKTAHIENPIHIAMMGCMVNGPGEAREADIGVVGGKRRGVIFRKGKIIKSVKEKDIVPLLLAEIKNLLNN